MTCFLSRGNSIAKRITQYGFIVLLTLAFSSAAAAETWRFGMTCDSRGYSDGINKVILSELAEQFVLRDIDLLIFPGDLISGMHSGGAEVFENQLRIWTQVMAPVYNAGIAVYVGRGNHEIPDNWGSYPIDDPSNCYAVNWLNVFGESADPNLKLPANGPVGEEYMTYSVAHKNALIVMLDHYAGLDHWPSHRINQDWLDAQLAANTRPHVFVTAHEPAFKAKNRVGFDLYPEDRDAFWASLADSGARVFFTGHDHFFNHSRIDDGNGDPNDDVHQYIVGTAGPMYVWNNVYPGDNGHYSPISLCHVERHGYVIGEVNDLDVTLTWYQRHTTVTDVNGIYEPNESWSYTVTPRPVLLAPAAGDAIAAESACRIRWTTLRGKPIYSVRLSCSLDGGENWEHIALSPNVGSYEWTVPPADSNRCLIRIEDARNGELADISDMFTIYQCPEDLLFDLDNNCYLDFHDFCLLGTVPHVEFADFAAFMSQWLDCANPFDEICIRPQ